MSHQLYEERLERIRKAVALQRVDRIPVAPGMNGYHAMYAGGDMACYCSDMEYCCGLALATFAEYEGAEKVLWFYDRGLG